MKFKNNVVILFSLALVSLSCNNDLKILAPYKNITVVYGLMDQSDTVHYIRIDKAFEGNGNAYAMAKQYDSIYYPVSSIKAVLEDSSPTTNTIVNTYTLDTTTAIPLSPGIFAYPKQLLYYTNAGLNPDDYYNLVITNTKTGKKTTASTAILPDVLFLSPPAFSANNELTLSNDTSKPSFITWSSSPNVGIYQMTIIFYYVELFEGTSSLQSVDWVFSDIITPNIAGGTRLSYSLSAQGLYSLIASSLQYKQGVVRIPSSLEVIFTSGTQDLNTYVLLSQPPIGINQDVPSFTNLKNAIGIFTARHIETFNKQIDGLTLDSLETEPRFIALGF